LCDIEPVECSELAYLGEITVVASAFVTILVGKISRLLLRVQDRVLLCRGRSRGRNPLHGGELVVTFAIVIIVAGVVIIVASEINSEG
jgi:hypothetical protein